jgi:hypothetical protein
MKKHGISQQIGKRKDDEAALQRRNIAAAHRAARQWLAARSTGEPK